MSVQKIEPAWKELYELLNDLIRQQNRDSMLNSLINNIDSVVPADQGVCICEVTRHLPYTRRWPDYTNSLAPMFNTYYNRKVPAPYDWGSHRLGPVDWRRYGDSEFDTDFNCPLGIGHSYGLGFPETGGSDLDSDGKGHTVKEGKDIVFVLHRSRSDKGFSEKDISSCVLIQQSLKELYALQKCREKNRCESLLNRELAPGCDLLSPREAEIARLLCRRVTQREIADLLCISTRTVERHALHIYQKLNLKGRKELARLLDPEKAALRN